MKKLIMAVVICLGMQDSFGQVVSPQSTTSPSPRRDTSMNRRSDNTRVRNEPRTRTRTNRTNRTNLTDSMGTRSNNNYSHPNTTITAPTHGR